MGGICGLTDKDRADLKLEMWKKTIDVQQHFNQLGLQLRNFAITLLVAVFGVIAVTQNSHIRPQILGITASLASWLLLGALLGWGSFYLMDRWWYHRLLVGAVEHGEFIEDQLKADFPEIALTKKISDASPFKLGSWNVHARTRLTWFYGLIGGALIVVAVVMWNT